MLLIKGEFVGKKEFYVIKMYGTTINITLTLFINFPSRCLKRDKRKSRGNHSTFGFIVCSHVQNSG